MHMSSALAHQGLRAAVPDHFKTQVPGFHTLSTSLAHSEDSKIIAAGRQMSDRHGTGLNFQFSEPLTSGSEKQEPNEVLQLLPRHVNKALHFLSQCL